MALCRGSYVIMGILRDKSATNKVYGMTIQEIQSAEQVSKPNTIHKRIQEMAKLGWLAEGLKAGRAKTYFLTEKGSAQLPEKIKKEMENDGK